jgi:hypothetical protein
MHDQMNEPSLRLDGKGNGVNRKDFTVGTSKKLSEVDKRLSVLTKLRGKSFKTGGIHLYAKSEWRRRHLKG